MSYITIMTTVYYYTILHKLSKASLFAIYTYSDYTVCYENIQSYCTCYSWKFECLQL